LINVQKLPEQVVSALGSETEFGNENVQFFDFCDQWSCGI
jgi:hypothetical protein